VEGVQHGDGGQQQEVAMTGEKALKGERVESD